MSEFIVQPDVDVSEWDLDPDAVLDFAVDWTAWLGAGETISTHEAISSAGITVDDSEEAGGVVTIWVSGASGRRQTVTCRVTTNQGRTDDRTITFNVTER